MFVQGPNDILYFTSSDPGLGRMKRGESAFLNLTLTGSLLPYAPRSASKVEFSEVLVSPEGLRRFRKSMQLKSKTNLYGHIWSNADHGGFDQPFRSVSSTSTAVPADSSPNSSPRRAISADMTLSDLSAERAALTETGKRAASPDACCP